MRRVAIVLIAAAVAATACTSAAVESDAAAAAGAVATEEPLLAINHLEPRPDFVGPPPRRFAWTPIAGVDTYAIGLVSEIDTMVWQRGDIPGAEVDWPAGLDLPAGTYFWMVEGFKDGRRVAESGRAAFVLER